MVMLLTRHVYQVCQWKSILHDANQTFAFMCWKIAYVHALPYDITEDVSPSPEQLRKYPL